MILAADNPFQRLLCIALTVYWIILIVYVVLSWLQVAGLRRPISGPGRAAFELLDDVVLPLARPLDKMIPPARVGGFGLSFGVLILFVVVLVLRTAFC